MVKAVTHERAVLAALEGYAQALADDNLVELAWTVRGIADALVDSPQEPGEADLYEGSYRRGYQAAKRALDDA